MNVTYKDGYGIEPRLLGNFSIDVDEMMFYMYLPIKLAGDTDFIVPSRLALFEPLVWAAVDALGGNDFVQSNYVYITAKHVYVTPEYRGNRKGWHCDGFMTDDFNFIWMDRCPTEFAIQPMSMLQDDLKSMDQMESTITSKNVRTYPPNELLMLDQYNIHRVSEADIYTGMRTFVKLSFSQNRYNLKGNSHNYLLDYKWPMHDRQKLRNVTDLNGDYVLDNAS